ncbi:MAG: serine/threonine protein kinase, partial [Anaerolineales bacterium]|nr:serine/threonine protein kinase [Anaerolineales bacterium]
MSELVGRILHDRYQVREFLGRGGMAEVYKVWDAHRSTFLAMKVLHQDLALDYIFMRRFQREADTLAQLQHPNIVRFYSLEQDGPLAFMLLDYIDGENLKRLIFEAAGPVAFEQTLAIFRAVCSALQFAHGEGMVHCDIKPGNIMIMPNGDAKLFDFGVARVRQQHADTEFDPGVLGALTPAYSSMQVLTSEEPVAADDVFSLSCLLYRLLAGYRVFGP